MMAENEFSQGFKAGYNGDQFVLAVKVRVIEGHYRSIALHLMEKINNVLPEGTVLFWDEFTIVFWTSFDVGRDLSDLEETVNAHLSTGSFVSAMFNNLFDKATGETYRGTLMLPPGDRYDITFDSSDRIFYPLWNCFDEFR